MEKQIIQEKGEELRDAGIIAKIPLDNPFAARPTIAAKKDAETGEWTDHRFCINYIRQNQNTCAHSPMPYHYRRRFFAVLARPGTYSKIDMRSGFHRLSRSDEESQRRTAFWWGDELWAYKRLPFGLKNSSAVYQRVMDTILGNTLTV
jgi:hypothetical protein